MAVDAIGTSAARASRNNGATRAEVPFPEAVQGACQKSSGHHAAIHTVKKRKELTRFACGALANPRRAAPARADRRDPLGSDAATWPAFHGNVTNASKTRRTMRVNGRRRRANENRDSEG